MTNLEIFNAKTVDETLSWLSKQWKKRRYVDHFDPRTVDDAISLLSQYQEEAKIIAGGVDLISLMKSEVTLPKVLVSINAIPDMTYIKEDAEGLKIGPLTTIHDIEMSAIIGDKYEILAEAAHSVAAPQIRNMATIGGNLCQSVRCWYYRRSPYTGRSFYCRRKGGEQCYSGTGENTYHAIIGAGECHAVCPSDMAPALIALNAKVKITGQHGNRIIPLEEFYQVMGNILEPGELIIEIQIPAPGTNARQKYLKFRTRKAIDFAIASVAATLTLETGVVSDARIVLGGVAPTPYRAIAAEDILKGEVVTRDVAEAAAEAALAEAIPLDMNGYKVPITEALVKEVLNKTGLR
ncbi:FAD binding domain-containing protein [Chloroflexota bacterium]